VRIRINVVEEGRRGGGQKQVVKLKVREQEKMRNSDEKKDRNKWSKGK
jgi:hypothetical protein